MTNFSQEKIAALLDKGVSIPNPETVYIAEEVQVDRISGHGTIIYSGCKLFGKSTLILDHAKLGYEAPVTIDSCLIGPETELKGGFFKQAVFLKKVIMGSGAQVREGTILEEQASVAHTVGLKQTILFPFVTLGSLINFCDCFMAGGTGRKNHSEVGSAFIHFNFTPNQDKATPSMMGDVPHGVMLNQAPIFLGGQGGLVGPCRLAFGTITAAGTINRKDELRPGRLILEGGRKGINIPYSPGMVQNVKRVVINNLVYILNMGALMQWYMHVRSQFISNDFPQTLLTGLIDTLDAGIHERIKQLKKLSEKMYDSGKLDEKSKALYDNFSELENTLANINEFQGNKEIRNAFLDTIDKKINANTNDYLIVIKDLGKADTKAGISWLQGIVDQGLAEIIKKIPVFGTNR